MENLIGLKSHGLSQRFWLFRIPGQAKAIIIKPLFWLGLAWPIWAWLGLAHGLRPGHSTALGLALPPPSFSNKLRTKRCQKSPKSSKIMTSASPFVFGRIPHGIPSEHGSLNLHSDLAPRFIVWKKIQILREVIQ